MAKRRSATQTEWHDAARIALGAIAADEDAPRELCPSDEHMFPLPADVLIELGADALALSGPTRADPVSLHDFAERHLRDFDVRGNTARRKLATAQHLVVATHAGVEPDYLAAAGWWQLQDLWFHAYLVLVGMLRVASEHTGRPVDQICAELMAHPDDA